ncbi:MAG: hypothetical protein Ct9H300mP25_00860 [Acidobacteriota bacterium]|nr:MAG: hypothetical protein Ct9H300mP25_00860 [Acidobacteriota bacterium]
MTMRWCETARTGCQPELYLETWTPTRRASRDLHYPAAFVGATPLWLAARFARVDIMRFLNLGMVPTHDLCMRWSTLQMVSIRLEGAYDDLDGGIGNGRHPRFRPWVPYTDPGTRNLGPRGRNVARRSWVDISAADLRGQTVLTKRGPKQYESVVTLLLERGAGNP